MRVQMSMQVSAVVGSSLNTTKSEIGASSMHLWRLELFLGCETKLCHANLAVCDYLSKSKVQLQAGSIMELPTWTHTMVASPPNDRHKNSVSYRKVKFLDEHSFHKE